MRDWMMRLARLSSKCCRILQSIHRQLPLTRHATRHWVWKLEVEDMQNSPVAVLHATLLLESRLFVSVNDSASPGAITTNVARPLHFGSRV